MIYRHVLLLACAALALGEYVASCAPSWSETWPVVAFALVFVVVFGYAWNVRGWPFLAVALLGALLFFVSSLEREREFRDSPWLRDARRHAPVEDVDSPLAPARRDFARRAALGIGHDRELVQLNRAILLGQRAKLPPKLKRTFVESGTIHVFAISGLHVMGVAHVLTILLRCLFVPRRFVGVVAVPILWAYVALIGAPPSAVRAAVMATLTCLAPLFWRRPDGVVAWALTYLGVHLLHPQMIVNVGCALSFAVMLSILVACDCLSERKEGWVKTLLVTIVAWAAGVPIAAHVFGRITPGGILANLALIPTAVVTVYAGATGLIASFVSETLAAHLNALSGLFTRAMVVLSDGVSRLPGANLEVPNWSVAICVEWYGALALVLVLRALLRRRRLSF